MKVSFPYYALSKGINIVMKAVSSKTTLPILKCILIDATKDKIVLFANDMELAITTEVEGTIEERGSIALDAKILSEIVRKLPEDDIDIQTDDRLMTSISSGNALFTIPGMEGSDFPPVPEVEKEESLKMSQYIFKEMIRQTIFSLDLNDNNILMTGELFEIRDHTLRLVALDGHRIAIRKIELAGNYDQRKEIVPGKTLNEVSKILSDNLEDTINICFSANHVLFEFGETCVYSRLIEGEYFHVDNMLGGEPQLKTIVNKKDFLSCLERADLLIREGDNRPIVLDITDDNMDISIRTTLGQMEDNLPVEKTGKDLRIGFNPRFMIDAIKAVDDEYITIHLINQKAPCFIKNEEETYLYLILPVNIL